jgi:subfamily B ATP-binding cassette protein MsbA
MMKADSPSGTQLPPEKVLHQLKRILQFAKPHWPALCGGFALFLLATTVGLVLPLGIKALLDTAIGEKNGALLNQLAVGLLGLFLLQFIFSFLGSYIMMLIGERIVIGLRSRLYEHLLHLDVKFFHNQRVGDLTSRIISDAGSIRSMVTENLVTTVLTLLQLTGALVIMVLMNWKLTLVVLIAAPAATAASQVFGPFLQRTSRKVQERAGGAVAVLQEVFNAVPMVKSFDREKFEVGRFNSSLAEVYLATRSAVRAQSLFRAVIGLVTSVATIAIFWAGGHSVLSGALTAGDLVAFLFYAQTISQGLSQLAQIYGSLYSVVGSSARVFELLDLKPEVQSAPGALVPDAASGYVRFRNVSFHYQSGQSVLSDVCFEVEPGKTIAIVGLSGAGKSSILKLIPRLYDPQGGAIELDGVDIRALDLSWLRQQIAIVSQDIMLFSSTVEDNICYGRLDATRAEILAAAVAANADEFIQKLPDGYQTQIGERGVKLSGGQRQRLSLARALLKDAPILVLDEATSSIDSLSEKLILDALKKAREGRTTLVVAHRLATVRDSDEILFIADGKIVQKGIHEDLIRIDGPYATLVESQLSAAPALDRA